MNFLLWWIYGDCSHPRASHVALVVKNPPVKIEDRCRFDPWVERSPGVGNGNPTEDPL